MENTFGSRLGNMLKERRLTQKKLSEMANVTQAAISHYVRGDRVPRANVLSRIAGALETTSDYLMNGVSPDSREEIAEAKAIILRNYARLTREDKIEIVSLLFEQE